MRIVSWKSRLLAVLIAAGAAAPTYAIDWKPGNGNYNDGTRWVGNVAPTSGDDAVIFGGIALQGGPNPAEGANIIVGANATLGTLNIADSSLTASNRLLLGQGNSVGEINQIGGEVFINGDGDLHIGDEEGSTGRYNFTGGEFTNGDDLLVGHGGKGIFNIGGTAKILGAGWIVVGDGRPGEFGVNAAEGEMNVTGGEITQSFGDWEIGDGGKGTVNATGGMVRIAGNVLIANQPDGDGTLNLGGNAKISSNEFRLGDEGTGRMVTSGGGWDAEVRAAMLVAPSGTASWRTELDASAAGTGKFRVADLADLSAATYDVAGIGATPAPGQVFPLIEAANGVTNAMTLNAADAATWAFFEVPLVGGGEVFGLRWIANYRLGDLNADTAVDNEDIDGFVAALLGGNSPAADLNMDGAVDNEDINPFVSALLGGNAAAVPEPSSVVLLVLGALGVVAARRRA